MEINKKEYKKYAAGRIPSSPVFANSLKAFLSGGAICAFAQWLKSVYITFLPEKDAASAVSVTLIFTAAFLTGIGVFDKIAKHAGAGTLVPITGFANAVSSCAIDARGEGFIMGVGAKIFTIAGPVILYSGAAGVLYGIIYYASEVL